MLVNANMSDIEAVRICISARVLSVHLLLVVYTLFFIRNLPQGLVLKVPYLKTSSQQIVVPKVP